MDQHRHGTVTAEQLRSEFLAAEGRPPRRYIVYDYGIDDTVILAHTVSVTRTADGFRVGSTGPGTLQLPGRPVVSFRPGTTSVPLPQD